MRPHRSPLLLLAALTLAACAEDSPTASRAPASAPLLAARGAAVEGSYLVVLREGGDARSVAAVLGIAPRHVYAAAVNGFAGTLNAGQLNALRHLDSWIKTNATAGVVKNVPAGTPNRLLYKAAL